MPLCKKKDGEDHREEYRKKVRQFHDRLYRDYQEYLQENEMYFPHEGIVELYGTGFTNYARYLKRSKSQHLVTMRQQL